MEIVWNPESLLLIGQTNILYWLALHPMFGNQGVNFIDVLNLLSKNDGNYNLHIFAFIFYEITSFLKLFEHLVDVFIMRYRLIFIQIHTFHD